MSYTYIDKNGAQQQIDLTEEDLIHAPKKANLSPQAYVNQKFADADLAIGSAFKQMQASVGICMPGKDNPFGMKATSMGQLLDGTAMGFNAATNNQQNTTPYGTSSRAFTVISIIDAIENAVAKDRTTDADTFYSMVGTTLALNSEHFEQPVISYSTLGGAEGTLAAKASRVSQGALPPRMAFFSTADRIRRIGSWTIGMEWTDQALKATSLDFVTMTMARYLAVERDERAYRYISDLFLGNNDMIVGAVTAVGSSTLDAASTGGVLTHRAWLKFLARSRKFRKITHVMGDLDTYLKLEGRTGRPGTVNYDPTLARLDPQAMMVNSGFGNDVKYFLVDSAADGGPVPANTLYAIDASNAMTLVQNAGATYSAVESYAIKRTQALRLDWAEEVMRTFGDTDLKPFDALTITP